MPSHKDLLVGFENSDDAGVFRINNSIALIQTLDFLTPVTDSPYEFGQIAAANSLSDVYAMGGSPLTAMNIVCFPSEDLDEDILSETLQGGIDKIHEADATLVGGHSVDDKEFKYGLSVTGLVHPQKFLANKGAESGDAIVLTKPVGTGILATAVKAGFADKKSIREMVKTMSMLNRYAADVMAGFKISSCTDVTGFGLAGHLLEMAKGSKKNIVLFTEKVPIISRAKEFALMGMVPAGAYKNKKFCTHSISIDSNVDNILLDLMFDPQTSGGLIFSLNQKDAQTCISLMEDRKIRAEIIGEVGDNDHCGTVTII